MIRRWLCWLALLLAALVFHLYYYGWLSWYLLQLLLLTPVLSLLVSLIQHVFRLPLLKQLDWLAGGAFGLVRGAMILYVIFLLLPIINTVLPLDAFNQLLDASKLAPVFMSDGFFAGVISGKL